MKIELEQIHNMIYLIRGQKVMLDSDLAELYDVETSALNRQVRRNLKRFPGDFMFELSQKEFEFLICKNGISKQGRGGRTKRPLVFTELGIAMLSSVLRSSRAVEVNILIMRIFVKLRSFQTLEDRVDRKINNLEQDVTKVFKVVFERLDNLEDGRLLQKKRKRIGLKYESR